MAIIMLNPRGTSKYVSKQVELVKLNGKYYIELDEFENSDCVVELSISLAKENDILKERIKVLEEKIQVMSEAEAK